MKVNLFSFDHLEVQKAELYQKLKLKPEVKVDLAYDVVHGLNDIMRSLANLHPHKMALAVLGAQPSPVREVIKGFAAQGFAIQELPVSLHEYDETKLQAAFEALKKDTLFVMCSALEPLTGLVYPFDWVRKEAAKRQIFTVIYQSPDSLKKGLIVPATPFEAIVADPLWGDEHTLTLIIKGERCQGERLFWGEPSFSDESLHLLERNLGDRASGKIINDEDQPLIKTFEERLIQEFGGSVQLLGQNIQRLYDRAVFFIEGVNGEALSHRLQEAQFETVTAAACAWNSPHINHWLLKLGLNEGQIQSSLIVAAETIRKPAFFDKLTTEISALRKISGYIKPPP